MKYDRMLFITKKITRKAVLNNATYDEVSENLGSILSSRTLRVEGEIRDATGHPKGRPRVRGFSQPDCESSIHYVLWDAETRSLRDCGHYGVFMEESSYRLEQANDDVDCGIIRVTTAKTAWS